MWGEVSAVVVMREERRRSGNVAHTRSRSMEVGPIGSGDVGVESLRERTTVGRAGRGSGRGGCCYKEEWDDKNHFSHVKLLILQQIGIKLKVELSEINE